MLRNHPFVPKNSCIRWLSSSGSNLQSAQLHTLNPITCLRSRRNSAHLVSVNNIQSSLCLVKSNSGHLRQLHSIALSSIWEKNEDNDQLYAGSSKAIFSTSYYRLHGRKDANTQEYFDRTLAQRLLTPSSEASIPLSFSSPFPQYAQVAPGDLVECSSKSGSFVTFGVIITQFASSSHILVFGLDGQLHKIPATNVKLHISRVFNGFLMLEIFAQEIVHLENQNDEKPLNLKSHTKHFDTPISSSIDSYNTSFSRSNLDTPISSDKYSYTNSFLNSNTKVPKASPDPKYRLTLLSLLRLLIRASLERYERGGMRDAFSVVYAHAASDSVRTFSLDYLSTEALNVLRKLPGNSSEQLKISSKLMYITSKVATHFYLTNSPQNWYAFPPAVSTNQLTGAHIEKLQHSDSKNGKWVPTPTVAAEDSLFVRHELTSYDWSVFGQYIRRVIVEKVQQRNPSFQLKSSKNDETETDEGIQDDEIDQVTFNKFSKILGVLKRYIVYPHQEYEELIKVILETVYGYNNLPRRRSFIKSTHSYSDSFPKISNVPDISSSSVHQMLIDANLVATDNAYLDSGLILDYEAGKIVDEYSEKAPEMETQSIIENNQIHFVDTHQKWKAKGKELSVYSVYVGEKIRKTVTLEKREIDDDEVGSTEGVMLENSKKTIDLDLASSHLAFSVQDNLTTTGRVTLHIHVPNAASWYSPTSSIMNVGLRRARTVWLPEGIRRMFPDNLLERVSFTEPTGKTFFKLLDELRSNSKDSNQNIDFDTALAGYVPENTKERPFSRCLTFSINIDLNNPSQWTLKDIDVSLTRILKKDMEFLKLENISRLMKWNASELEQHSDIQRTNFKNMNEEEEIDDDEDNIFGFEKNEKMADVDPHNIFVTGDNEGMPISKKPLEWMTSNSQNSTFLEEESLPNLKTSANSINKNYSHLKANVSESGSEAQHIPIQTHKDLVLIRKILESNYWKRMKDCNAVYETDTDEYGRLVSVGSKSNINATEETETEAGFNTPRSAIDNRNNISIGLNKSPQSRFHLNDPDFLITEAGLLIAEIAAAFGAHHNLPLLYEKQDRVQEFDLGTNDSSQPHSYSSLRTERATSSTKLRDESGLLTHTGRYLAASSQYLGPRETTTSSNYVHFGLGIMTGFVGISRPFDDMRHVINQWQFTSFLISQSRQNPSTISTSSSLSLNRNQKNSSNGGFIKPPWRLLSAAELQLVYDTKIHPRANVLSQFESISQRYWALRRLEQEVMSAPVYSTFRDGAMLVEGFNTMTNDRASANSNGMFFGNSTTPLPPHVFRCIIVSPKTAYPDFARAYCVELGFEVDIMLPPPSASSIMPNSDKNRASQTGFVKSTNPKSETVNFFDKIKRPGTSSPSDSKHPSSNPPFSTNGQQLTQKETEKHYCDVLEKVYGGQFGVEPKLSALNNLKNMNETGSSNEDNDTGYTVLKAGDRVIGTRIIELDPTRGHLVLGI